MPESKMPNQERQPRNRSYGSFLLFLTILVAILFLVGRDSFSPEKELTQDEYLLQLYTGKVAQQEFRGDGTIRGRTTQQDNFVVHFGDLGDRKAELQQLKAVPRYTSIDEARFRSAIDDGEYTPLAVRLVT